MKMKFISRVLTVAAITSVFAVNTSKSTAFRSRVCSCYNGPTRYP